MRLIRDVPSTVLRMAVFKLLKEGQTIPIHGSVPKGAKLPYITLGAATFKPLSNKDLIIWDASLNVEVWAGDDGKKQVNETLNDICALISAYGCDMELPQYRINSTQIDLVEDFPEVSAGYHGTVTILFTIQNFNKKEV